MKDELQHVGILGMKWGKRKPPNHPDHDLLESRPRLRDMSNKELKAYGDRKIVIDRGAGLGLSSRKSKDKVRTMSNKEVAKLLKRTDLNKRVTDISDKQYKEGMAFALASLAISGSFIIAAIRSQYG